MRRNPLREYVLQKASESRKKYLKAIIPIVLAITAVVIFVLLNVKEYKFAFYLEEESYALPKGSFLDLLSTSDNDSKGLLSFESGSTVYIDDNNGQYYVGEDKTEINTDYPVFTRSGEVLYFLNNNSKLINKYWKNLPSYEGMRLSNGTTYNSNGSIADLGDIILINLYPKYQLAQDLTLSTYISDNVIKRNTICSFNSEGIDCYEYNDGIINSYHLNSYGDATVKIDDLEYSYKDFLKLLGISNSEDNIKLNFNFLDITESDLEGDNDGENAESEDGDGDLFERSEEKVTRANTIIPKEADQPTSSRDFWKMCEINVDPNATPWTYTISFDYTAKDEASIVKTGVQFVAWEKISISAPSIEVKVPTDEINPRAEGWLQINQNEHGGVTYTKTEDRKPQEGRIYVTSSSDLKDVVAIKKVYYKDFYYKVEPNSNSPLANGFYEASFDESGNTVYSLTADESYVPFKQYYEMKYDYYPSIGNENPNEIGLYDKVDDNYVLTSDTSIPCSWYKKGNQAARNSFYIDLNNPENTAELGTLKPSTEYLISYGYSYYDKLNAIQDALEFIGVYTTLGYDQLNTISLSFDGDECEELEVFQNRFQVRGLRYDNIYNGQTANIGDLAVAQVEPDPRKTETYVIKITVEYQEVGFDSSGNPLPAGSSWSSFTLDSSTINVVKKGFKLEKFESKPNLSFGKQYYYRVRLFDKYSHEFTYSGNMATSNVPNIYSAYTCKNIPTVTFKVPNNTNKPGGVIVNSTFKNDSNATISNFNGFVNGQNITSYNAVMFITPADKDCVPENAILISGINTKTDDEYEGVYFFPISIVDEVVPGVGDNPSSKNWLELAGSNYVFTTDTSVNSSKTYYQSNSVETNYKITNLSANTAYNVGVLVGSYDINDNKNHENEVLDNTFTFVCGSLKNFGNIQYSGKAEEVTHNNAKIFFRIANNTGEKIYNDVLNSIIQYIDINVKCDNDNSKTTFRIYKNRNGYNLNDPSNSRYAFNFDSETYSYDYIIPVYVNENYDNPYFINLNCLLSNTSDNPKYRIRDINSDDASENVANTIWNLFLATANTLDPIYFNFNCSDYLKVEDDDAVSGYRSTDLHLVDLKKSNSYKASIDIYASNDNVSFENMVTSSSKTINFKTTKQEPTADFADIFVGNDFIEIYNLSFNDPDDVILVNALSSDNVYIQIKNGTDIVSRTNLNSKLNFIVVPTDEIDLSSSPNLNGWYEKVNNDYVLSNDDSVALGKAYYKKYYSSIRISGLQSNVNYTLNIVANNIDNGNEKKIDYPLILSALSTNNELVREYEFNTSSFITGNIDLHSMYRMYYDGYNQENELIKDLGLIKKDDWVFDSSTKTYTNNDYVEIDPNSYYSLRSGFNLNPNNNTIIPSSLKQIEYIESIGNQFIDTKYYPNSNSTVEIKGNLVNESTLFGNETNDDTWFCLDSLATHNNYRYRNGSSDEHTFGTYGPNPSVFVLDNSDVVLDGVSQGLSLSSVSFESQFPAMIFARRKYDGTVQGVAGAGARIYYVRISENDSIIHNFIPCVAVEEIPNYRTNINVRVPSGTAGLYDTVGQIFYVNSGTGNFDYPSLASSEENSFIKLSVYKKIAEDNYELVNTYSGNNILNGNIFKLDETYTDSNYYLKIELSNLPSTYPISNIVFEKYDESKVDIEHNLLDSISDINGFVDNYTFDEKGTRVAAEGYSITNDYIEIKPDSIYYVNGLSAYSSSYYDYDREGSTIDQVISEQSSSSASILFYSETKEYLGSVETGAQGSLFKTPSNAKYVRLTIRGKQTSVNYDGINETDELPSAYKQLEYIEGASAQTYIDTGIYGGNDTRVVETMAANNVAQFFFGARSGSTSREYSVIRTDAGYINVRHNNKDGRVVAGSVLCNNTPFTIDKNNNVTKFYRDDTLLYTNTLAASTFQTQYTLFFPGLNQNGSSLSYNRQRVYRFTIYKPTTTKVRDFIPCYRIYDDVAGMYDLVEKRFYPSNGTVGFTKGPEVGTSDSAKVFVGTPYHVDSMKTYVRRNDNNSISISFQPKATGTYTFYTNNLVSGDPFLTLYDEDYTQIVSDDDSGENHNAKITHTLSSNKSYYRPISFEPAVPFVDNPKTNGWFVLNGSNYVLTNDLSPQTGTTYYEAVYDPVTAALTDNPHDNNWYEFDEATYKYVSSGDIIVDSTKNYYSLNYVEATLYVNSPKIQTWYELSGGLYVLSDDDAIVSGVNYYVPNEFEEVEVNGTENPSALNWYTKVGSDYNLSGSSTVERRTYHIVASNSNKLIGSIINYDVCVDDYQYSFNHDGVGLYLYQLANLDSFNIEFEASISQEIDKFIDKDYYKLLSDGTMALVGEEDIDSMFDLGSNPADLGFYEQVFTLTNDETPTPDKVYYLENAYYEKIIPVGDENPSTLGWYTYIDNKYVLSEDTSVEQIHSYFTKHSNNEFNVASYVENPKQNGLYEVSYQVTTDDEIDKLAHYYAEGGKASIVLYKTKEKIDKSVNLELLNDDDWAVYSNLYSNDDLVGTEIIKLGNFVNDYYLSTVIEANFGYKAVLNVTRKGRTAQIVLDYVNVSAIQPTYIIKDIPTLKAVANDPNGYYICIADIMGIDFTVYDGVFTGVIDFQGHTLELNTDNYLFNQLSSEATINNVNLVYDALVNDSNKDIELPSGYTILESITSSGTQYIDTGYSHNLSTRYETEILPYRISNESFWTGVFGYSPANAANSAAIYINSSDSYYEVNIGEKINTPNNSVVFNKWQKLQFNSDYFSVDDYTYELNKTFTTVSYTDYLFAVNKDGTAQRPNKLGMKYFKIYEDDVLVHHFVPCMNSSNQVGMYDVVGGGFFGNAGSGEFSCDVSYSEDGSTLLAVSNDGIINYSNITNSLGGEKACVALNNYGNLSNVILHIAADTEMIESYVEPITYYELTDSDDNVIKYRLIGNSSWYKFSSSTSEYEIDHPTNQEKNAMIKVDVGSNEYKYTRGKWHLENSTDPHITDYGEVTLSPDTISGFALVNTEYNPCYTSPYTFESNTAGLVLNNYGSITNFAVNFENDVYVKDNVSAVVLNNYGSIKNGYVSGSMINNNVYLSNSEVGNHHAGFIHRYNYIAGATKDGSGYHPIVEGNNVSANYISYISSHNYLNSNIENVYVVNDIKFQSEVSTSSELGPWDTRNSGDHDVLPDQFIYLDYIKADGNEYIDTGLTTGDGVSKIITDFSFDYPPNAGFSIFGAGVYGYARCGLLLTLYFNGQSPNSYFYSGSTNTPTYNSFNYSWEMNTRYNVIAEHSNNNRKLTINDAVVVNATKTAPNIDSNLKYFIFANSETETPKRYSLNTLMYGMQMYIGEERVRNFVPCVAVENIPADQTANGVKAPSGTMGLYDTVEGLFYFSFGSGSFTHTDNAELLPNEYKQVDYIESYSYGTTSNSKGQYIKTGVVTTFGNKYNWDIVFSYSKYENTYSHVMSIDSLGYNINIGKSGASTWQYTGQESGSTYSTSATLDVKVRALGSSIPTASNTGDLWLFCQNKNFDSVNKSSMKLYSAKIYENDILIRNFVPCYRKSDRKPGLFDTVGNMFYVNEGDEDFYTTSGTLPADYQRVEYLQSNGNQYINTGYIHNANTKYDTIVSGNPSATTSTTYNSLFGARHVANNYAGSFAFFTQTSNRLHVNNNSAGISYTVDGYTIGNRRMHITLDSSSLIVNSNLLATMTPGTFAGNDLPCYLFGVNTDGAVDHNKKTNRLYYFKIFEGNTLLHEYIPCYRKSDGEAGVYDLVTGSFLTNSGTGTFVKGPDVVDPSSNAPTYDFSMFGTDYSALICGHNEGNIINSYSVGDLFDYDNTLVSTSDSIYQKFKSETIMYRQGPSVGANVGLATVNNVHYASLDTDGLNYYTKDDWGVYAKNYMHNGNVGTRIQSLSDFEWQQSILGQDGINFVINNYLSASKFPSLQWPSTFATSTIPLIDLPVSTTNIKVLSNTVKLKGLDKNGNQAVLLSIDYSNPSKLNVTDISIVDDSVDGQRELTCKVLANNPLSGSTYRLDVLVTYNGNDVIATTDAEVVSFDNKKIEFGDGTSIDLISQKSVVNINDYNLSGRVVAISANAQNIYHIKSINGNTVASSGDNDVKLDFYHSISSVDDWKKYLSNSYSNVEGNFRIVNDISFINSTSSDDWYVSSNFYGTLDGAIYDSVPTQVADSLGNSCLYDDNTPIIINNETQVIGLRKISGIGNVNENGEYIQSRGYSSSNELYTFETPNSSKFSLFYRLYGKLQNIVFSDFVTIRQYDSNNSLYDVTTPICGVVQIADTGAIIDNCHVRNSTFNTKYYGGALVGYANGAKISNSSAKNTSVTSNFIVSSNYYSILGGLVGYSNNSNINNCFTSSINVNNTAIKKIVGTGGLIGVVDYSNIYNCYVGEGTVNSYGDCTGGLIGKVSRNASTSKNEYDNQTSIQNCWTSVDVQTTAGDYVGGLVGYMGIYNGSNTRNSANKLNNCYTSSTILSLAYESTHINRITCNYFENQGYYSNNFAFVNQSINFKNHNASDVGIYQYGPSNELNGANRLLKVNEINKPSTWIDEINFDTSGYELLFEDSDELSYMPKLFNSNTGELLYDQNDEKLGLANYAQLEIVSITNQSASKYLSVTFDLRNTGWDQNELLTYNSDLSQGNWNKLATWSDMVCSGGKMDYREEGVIDGLFIKPVSVRNEGGSAVIRFVSDIYYDDPLLGHYTNNYLVSIPVFLNSPTVSPRLSSNAYALVIVDENNKVKKDIFDALEWNEFFSSEGSHYNSDENIRLTGNLYNFDAVSDIDGSANGGSGTPAYNVKLNSLEVADNVHPVFTGLIEYEGINDISFIDYVGCPFNDIVFKDFTIDYGNASNSSYTGIFSHINEEFKNNTFDNVTIKNANSNYVGIIGCVSEDAKISDITLNDVSVEVNGNHQYIGGFIGTINGSVDYPVSIDNIIANSINVICDDDNSQYVGGIFGRTSYAEISNVSIDGKKIEQNLDDNFIDLDYIEANGYQYIDLGFNNIGNFKIDTKVTLNNTKDSVSTIIGSGNNFNIYANNDNSLYVTSNNSSAYINNFDWTLDRTFRIMWNSTNSISVDYDDFNLSSNLSYINGNLGNNLYVFANNNSGSANNYGSLRMYYLRIYDGDHLIHNLIPRKANKNNTIAYRGNSQITVNEDTIGLYDLCTNRFYVDNNGFNFTNENHIPSIFQQVDYIQSDNHKRQYIKTGLSLEDGYRISGRVMELSTSNLGSDALNSSRYIFGSQNSSSTQGISIKWGTSVDGNMYVASSSDVLNNIPLNADIDFDMGVNSEGSYINYLGFNRKTYFTSANLPSSELYLFSCNLGDNVASNFGSSRIYNLKIFFEDGETLRRNFIPVVAKENIPANFTNINKAVNKGTVGLYDTVSGKFFINSNEDNTNFYYQSLSNELPQELKQVEYIQSVDNAYIDTGLPINFDNTYQIDFDLGKTLNYYDDYDEKQAYIFGGDGFAARATGRTVNTAKNIFEIIPKELDSSDLPGAYTKLRYIEFSGSQTIDTGIDGTECYGIEFGYCTESLLSSYQTIIGSVEDNFTFGNYNRADAYYIRIRTSERKRVTSGVPTNTMNSVSILNNKCIVNGTQVATYTSSNALCTLTGNIIIGNGSNLKRSSNARFYYVKLYDADQTTLLRDYVPCYRKADHVLGLYDKVSGKFYPNENTDNFVEPFPSIQNLDMLPLNYGVRHNIMFNLNTSYAVVDNEGLSVNMAGLTSLQSDDKLTIFHVNSNDVDYFTPMTLYHYAQYDSNGKLLINLIPCYASSSVNYATTNGVNTITVPAGTVGLYDTVSQKMFVNSGSGKFVCENNYSKLPSTYTLTKAITSNGTNYINTGLFDKNNYTFELRFKANSMDTGILGSNNRGIVVNSTGSYVLDLDGSNSTEVGFIGDTITAKLNNTMLVNLDSTKLDNLFDRHTYDDDENGDEITLLKYNGSSLGNCFGELYYFKAYDEHNILLRDMIPCYNNDGTVGMYDLVSEQFFTSSIGSNFGYIVGEQEELIKDYKYENEFDYKYSYIQAGEGGNAGGISAYSDNTTFDSIKINRVNVRSYNGYSVGGFSDANINTVFKNLYGISNSIIYGWHGGGLIQMTTSANIDKHYVSKEGSDDILYATKVNNIKMYGRDMVGGVIATAPVGVTHQYYYLDKIKITSCGASAGGFAGNASASSSSFALYNIYADNINISHIYSSDCRNAGGLVGYTINNNSLYYLIVNNVKIRSRGDQIGGVLGNTNTNNSHNSRVSNVYISAPNNAYVGGYIGYFNGAIYFSTSPVYNVFVSSNQKAAGYFGNGGQFKVVNCDLINAYITTKSTYAGGYSGPVHAATFQGCKADRISINGTGNMYGGLVSWSDNTVSLDANMQVNNINIRGVSNIGGILGVYSGSSGSHQLTGANIEVTNIDVLGRAGDCIGGLLGGTGPGNYYDNTNNFKIYDSSIVSLGGNFVGGAVGMGWTSHTLTVGRQENATSDIPGALSKDQADVYVQGKRYVGGVVGYFIKLANSSGHIQTNSVYNTYIVSYSDNTDRTSSGGIVGYCQHTPTRFNGNYVENVTIIDNSTLVSPDITTDSGVGGIVGNDSSDTGSSNFSNNNVKDTLVFASCGNVGGIAGKLFRTDDITDCKVTNSIIVGGGIRLGGIVATRNLGNITNSGIEDTYLISNNGKFVGGIIGQTNYSGYNSTKQCNLNNVFVRSSGVVKGYTLQTVLNRCDPKHIHNNYDTVTLDTYNKTKNKISNLDRYNTIIIADTTSNDANNNAVGGIAGVYRGMKVSNCYVGSDVLVSSYVNSGATSSVGGLFGLIENKEIVNYNTEDNITSNKIQTVNDTVCQADIAILGEHSNDNCIGSFAGSFNHTMFTTKQEGIKYNQSWDYKQVRGIDPLNNNNFLFTGSIKADSSTCSDANSNLAVGKERIYDLSDININTIASDAWTFVNSDNTIISYPLDGSTVTFATQETYNGPSRIDLTKNNYDLYYFDGYSTCNPSVSYWYELNGSGSYVLTTDIVPTEGKNYYYFNGSDYVLVNTYTIPYGKSLLSNRAEGIGRLRYSNPTDIYGLTNISTISSDNVTNHIEPLFIENIGDGKDASNPFLYTGAIDAGNMHLNTWFTTVWSDVKQVPLTVSRPRLTSSNNNVVVKNLIDKLDVYASSIDTINLELNTNIPDDLSYSVSTLDNEISSTWSKDIKTISFKYDFNSDLSISFSYNDKQEERIISINDIRRSITTCNNTYWYLYNNKLIDSNNDSYDDSKIFIHLYDNYALDNEGHVYDLTNKQYSYDVSEFMILDEPKPLWSGIVESDDSSHLIKSYRTYSLSDDILINNSTLYVINYELISLSSNSTIISAPLVFAYNDKKYVSTLTNNHRILDLQDELNYPESFNNESIVEISDSVDYNGKIMLVRYDSGKLVAFDMITGQYINVLSINENPTNIFKFVANSFNKLFRPGGNNEASGILNSVDTYEQEVNSSPQLQNALKTIENNFGLFNNQNNESNEMQIDDTIDELPSQETVDQNLIEENVVENEESTTQNPIDEAETIDQLEETDDTSNSNDDDLDDIETSESNTYVVNNKYVSIYDDGLEKSSIYNIEQLLDNSKEEILSEDNKAELLKDIGLSNVLNARKDKVVQSSGIGYMALIAILIISLLTSLILIWTKHFNNISNRL